MLLRGVLINGSTWYLSVTAADGLGVPDEVLEQVALVLDEHEILGLSNDFLEIGDQVATFL